MIEKLLTPDGQTVFRLNGCLLSSRIDPRQEAKSWLESRRELLLGVRTIVVLGLGSGYHIEELLSATTADILVIENNSLLIAAFSDAPDRADLLKSSRVTVAQVSNLREVRQDRQIRAAASRSFIVLDFPASVNRDREFYRSVRELLLGRHWGSLTWQWQLKSKSTLHHNPRVESSDQPLTILDLEKTDFVQNRPERERMLVKALRELVK